MKIEIRKLQASDDRTHFSSGNIELDRFFINFAGQNQFKHNIGTTYIAIDKSDSQIAGYVAVSVSSMKVEGDEIREFKRLPKYPLPILRITRLAVEHSFQSKGIGRELLKEMLYLAMDIKEKAGCIGVVVDAKEEAVSFYEKFGFKVLPIEEGELHVRPRQITMYLSIKKMQKTLQ